MKNFQEFLDDLICLLKGNKVFSVRWKICRSSSTICFVSWLNRRSFCVSGSMFCTNEKKVGWGKKLIEREKRYDWHICCQKKIKFISVKKLARRVVYKLQESVNSVILFNAFVASINNITPRYCKSPMTLHEDRSTHENHWGFNSRAIVIVLINNAIVCRSSLKSRFVSISHCNLNFWDFFQDHVVSLKKKYLIELITFREFVVMFSIAMMNIFLFPSSSCSYIQSVSHPFNLIRNK